LTHGSFAGGATGKYLKAPKYPRNHAHLHPLDLSPRSAKTGVPIGTPPDSPAVSSPCPRILWRSTEVHSCGIIGGSLEVED